MSVSVLVKNTCPSLGEGPHWEPRTKSLLYVDINAHDIHRYDTVTGQDSTCHLSDTVSFVIPRRLGGYVVGLGRTLSVVDWDTHDVTKLVEVDHGTRNLFNDGKCDVTGRLWAATYGHSEKPGEPERHMGTLYSLDHGSIRAHVDKLDLSNGLAWSLDNTTMFFIDTLPRHVYAFDFDSNTGTISNRRVAVDFSQRSIDDLGFPDGMTIDNEGKIWIACFMPGKVVRFDPETGQELQTVTFPAKRITSCCFGGDNYDELYVTSALLGADEEERKAFPLGGSVFKVTGLGVKGAPAPVFEG